MPRKPSAHSQLDQLRQQAATERMKRRELEGALASAEQAADAAARAVVIALADEQPTRIIAGKRKAEATAVTQLEDLRRQLAASGLRVERAQHAVDAFMRDGARDLLEEREADAKQLALNLTRAGHEVVRAHRAYTAMRVDIDSLVAAVPGAVVRADGPPSTYAWEARR